MGWLDGFDCLKVLAVAEELTNTALPPPPSCNKMATENDADQELLDYDEDVATGDQGGANGADEAVAPDSKKGVKGSYVSIHSSGFRDFLLKPELLRAIVDCGFEHPSEGVSAWRPSSN